MAVADNDDNPFSFSNFIIMKDSSGAFRTPFVLTYEMADDFIEEYLVDKDISKFRGKITKYILGPMDAQRVVSRNPNTNDPEPGSGGSAGTPPTQDGNVVCETVSSGGSAPVPVDTGGGGGWYQVCEINLHTIYDYDMTNDGQNPVWLSWITYDNCQIVFLNQFAVAGSTTCPSGTGDGEIPVIEPELWEIQIDDSLLKPCMQSILTDLKTLNKGMSWVIDKFQNSPRVNPAAGPIVPLYNWTMKDGTPSSGQSATTAGFDVNSNTVTTTFKASLYQNASDLSIARTILHESIHAFLVAHFAVDRSDFQQNYNLLLGTYAGTSVINDLNGAHHVEFVRGWINDIAKSLEEFGAKRGYTLPSQYYKDLAWGGLTDQQKNGVISETEWFLFFVPNANDRKRIKDNISIEAYGVDIAGVSKPKKGNNGGC